MIKNGPIMETYRLEFYKLEAYVANQSMDISSNKVVEDEHHLLYQDVFGCTSAPFTC